MARLLDEAGSLRSAFAGVALLAVGTCLGILVGSILDAPRLLLERLQEPVETVELAPESGVDSSDMLVEYEALQEVAPPPRKPPPVAKLRPKKEEPRAEPKPAPKPKTSPKPKTPAPAAQTQPTAQEVIDAIARRSGSPAVAAAPTGGRVVQVGAFPDTRSAQAVVDRLQAQGFAAYVSGKASGKNLHRVRVRPRSGQQVSALASDLKGRGFDVWVTSE